MLITVVISTYNAPAALERVLWGYRCQSDRDFEVVIADDGSKSETRELIAGFQRDFPVSVRHVWHEDAGFRKNIILNRAILASDGDYLVFTDGDCVPRDDFVESHRRCSRPNRFLSGGSHIDIPGSIHQSLDESDVSDQRLFDHRWLSSQGMNSKNIRNRLTRNRRQAGLMDALTRRPGVLVGCNSSAWKRDVLAVNGFDESLLTYGSEDKDLGVRLRNYGLSSRRLKYSLVCVHLSHPRSYASAGQVVANKAALRRTRANRITWIDQGIEKRRATESSGRLRATA